MKIGLIDLDTSHPQSFLPILRELGHEVVAITDRGDIHPPGYAEQFAQTHGIPTVSASPEALLPLVDGVIIHSCDWSRHVETARPFVEAGKSVLIDKPLAGNRADLETIARWAAEGRRITGGSSLRFCDEVVAWNAGADAPAHTVFGGCAVDEYNYGIHAYSMACAIIGPGVISAQHLGTHGQRRIVLRWADGRAAFLAIGKQAKWMPFHLTILSNTTVAQLQAAPANLYRAFLTSVLPFLSGETETPPVLPNALIEAELAALAARLSWLENDREVLLADLPMESGYDGPAFACEYRAARYPKA